MMPGETHEYTVNNSMVPAAIGIRAHSGWAALVVVCGGPGTIGVIDRRRIALVDPAMAGGSQPYHFAQRQKLAGAEEYLATCSAASEGLAFTGLTEVLEQMWRRDYSAAICAILTASGRPLPALPKILAAHPLIHTAEGEFFRQCLERAASRLGMQVARTRERDLATLIDTAFGSAASELKREIVAVGRTLGPPWTLALKNATLAAILALSSPSVHL